MQLVLYRFFSLSSSGSCWLISDEQTHLHGGQCGCQLGGALPERTGSETSGIPEKRTLRPDHLSNPPESVSATYKPKTWKGEPDLRRVPFTQPFGTHGNGLEQNPSSPHVLVLQELLGLIPLLFGALKEKSGEMWQGNIIPVEIHALQWGRKEQQL